MLRMYILYLYIQAQADAHVYCVLLQVDEEVMVTPMVEVVVEVMVAVVEDVCKEDGEGPTARMSPPTGTKEVAAMELVVADQGATKEEGGTRVGATRVGEVGDIMVEEVVEVIKEVEVVTRVGVATRVEVEGTRVGAVTKELAIRAVATREVGATRGEGATTEGVVTKGVEVTKVGVGITMGEVVITRVVVVVVVVVVATREVEGVGVIKVVVAVTRVVVAVVGEEEEGGVVEGAGAGEDGDSKRSSIPCDADLQFWVSAIPASPEWRQVNNPVCTAST